MTSPPPVLETPRLTLRLPGAEAAEAIWDYCVRNRAHLEPWEPARPPEFYTVEHQALLLARHAAAWRAGRGVRLYGVSREPGADPQRILCNVGLSNIVRGAFQACHLGFSVDAGAQGRGLAREAVGAVVRYAFEGLGLHRVMANYQPHNARSERLLQALGFAREGYAKAYLHLDGAWRDHVLTALVRPEA